MNNSENRIRDILIVGGGTAGWMTAAALANAFTPETCRIRLIESDQIGTVGVGEATIPHIQVFNNLLGIDENDFIKKTQGTFKLGIQFVNWGHLGNQYIHPFGTYGNTIGSLTFYNYWLKYHQQGKSQDIGDFSLAVQAALRGKFTRPLDMPNSPLAKIGYAFHFDAGLYAKYLRNYAEQRGVERIEGEILNAELNSGNGFIKSVLLKTGDSLTADLFIDCTGFSGLLIERTLNTGFENWSNLLLCDSAVTVPSKNAGSPPPFTRSTAHSSGWQWRIPLQHRTGNGHVFSSKYMDVEYAKKILLDNLDGDPLAEPRLVKFKTGMRKKFWNKNCVAIGLASGFLEPLESTSIHLIQSSIIKLLAQFPTLNFEQTVIDRYNEILTQEFLSIRDFIVLHYKASQRTDSPFWNYCRTMDVPQSLQKKIELYESSGCLMRDNNELFDEVSWVAVMHGQGLKARNFHPLVNLLDDPVLDKSMTEVKMVINNSAEFMPTHADFIARYCAAQ